MHAHLKASQIAKLINENITSFLDTTIDLEVLIRSFFKPMRVQAHFFKPRTSKLLQQPILIPAEGDEAPQLVRYACAPIGILVCSLSEMIHKCRSYIDEMVLGSK